MVNNMSANIPTATTLTAEAAEYGYNIQFEHVTTTLEDVWVDGDELYAQRLERIEVDEYQGYDPNVPYGVWVKISADPEKLHHGFYVVHTEDGAPTDGVAYETLRAALDRISRLIDRQNA